MNFLDVIATKRDGRANSPEDLKFLATGAAEGSIPDYQLSAWLMAACLNGLDPQETADLTLAMAHSGERLDLTGLPKPWLDKHSTGGVGDKTTLVVLPILAACGVTMVKMSGRGLGITGGTIDKLESVPGFRTDLTPEEMIAQAKRIGIALSGQTPRLAPADKALYALRDVTGTVASIPLITASILSKKIAGGAETVVLDVKCGSGAFMKTLPEAEALARSLVDTGKLCGLKISAVITDMDQPLGMAVGNAMEVKEAASLIGPLPLTRLIADGRVARNPSDRFLALCVRLAGHALEVAGVGDEATVEECILSGAAQRKMREWFSAQGATIDPTNEFSWQPTQLEAAVLYEGPPGWVSRVCAQTVGEVAVELGGGRIEKEDLIDPTVGVAVISQIGSPIATGDPVFTILAADQAGLDAVHDKLLSAIEVSPERVPPVDPILKILHECQS